MKKADQTKRQHSPAEKLELIRLVEQSSDSVRKTLKEIQLSPSTFYRWYADYLDGELQGLQRKKPQKIWNQLIESEKALIREVALDKTDFSPREIAFRLITKHELFVSESTVYRYLKAENLLAPPRFNLSRAADEYNKKTEKVHEMWQTDFTYFKVIHWGYHYLCTVLDDYSRFIIAWDLHARMEADHAEITVAKALENAGISTEETPNLLSDNGPCFVAKDFQTFLEKKKINHIRGRPYHPQTQGKIERYHRSIKNVILLDVYRSPLDLAACIQQFVDYYNHERFHEALKNCTPADVYFGRQQEVLEARAKLKVQAMAERKSRFRSEKE